MEPVNFTNITFEPFGITVEQGAVIFKQYGNGDIAIQVVDDKEGLYTTATVNLEAYGIHPEPGHVIIADYSENQGVWKALAEIGVISEPVREFSFGEFDARAVSCKLLVG